MLMKAWGHEYRKESGRLSLLDDGRRGDGVPISSTIPKCKAVPGRDEMIRQDHGRVPREGKSSEVRIKN